MSLLSLITTTLLFGGLADAIDSDEGAWLQSYPIRSGLSKRLVGKDLQERSNTDFATMIGAKILPHPNCGVTKLITKFGLKGDDNYACWCGAGTINAKMFKPQNVLDRVCRAHDICYDKVHDEGCHDPYDVKYWWNYKVTKAEITCHDVGQHWKSNGLMGITVTQNACQKKYCECDKIMVDTVYKEMTLNGVTCPTEDSKCATRAFTKLEDSYCKGTYNRKYESLDDAQKACENDAQCFGVYDRNCGQTNVDKSQRYQRCNIDKNKERHTSVSKRCVYVKDTNMNCQCDNSAPWTIGDSTGKKCEGSEEKGFAGEPFCWIKSSQKHACTDIQRDNKNAEVGKLADTASNWYYSTMPCITPSKPWADAYKCPNGVIETVFNGKKGYLRDDAKCRCQSACDNNLNCYFANLKYTHSKATMRCQLIGTESRCGDWRNTRDPKYYIYQKDEETERCVCENRNGKNPNNGIKCKTPGKTSWSRKAHCAGDEKCTGPIGNDAQCNWVHESKKAELCECATAACILRKE